MTTCYVFVEIQKSSALHEMASPVESAVLVAPVTALEFLGDEFLLTGEGPILSVYSLQASPSKCASLSVLRNFRIHGIRPRRKQQSEESQTNNIISSEGSVQNDEELIVFGGKAVRLISFSSGGQCLKPIGPLLELQDWVLDIHWLPEEPDTRLAVSLAHNALLLLEAESGNVLSFYSCAETCLLYSALIIGSSWDSLVLVGGTVFNQLVLWRPKGSKPDGQSQVERRLLGHSGVIFSLCYLKISGWLASASDDRSIRLWNVGTLGGDAGCGEESPTCLRVLYGHQARVFCVRLTPSRVFSAGEDGACLLWEWEGEGKVGRTFKGHRSGGVRALAVSEGNMGCRRGWVATGGADGEVRVWRVAEEKNEEREEAQTESQIDLGFKAKGCPKVIRSVGEVTSNTVLVCTDQGEVCLSQNQTWDVIWQGAEEFQSYCVMEVTSVQVQKSSSVVWVCAVGNLNGGVQVFPVGQPDVGVLLKAGPGKVHSVLWVKGQFEGCWGSCLLVSGSEGLVYRWKIDVIESETGLRIEEKMLSPFLLPPCAKRWLTAAVTLSHPKQMLYLCGDRRGSLLLYTETERNNRRHKDREDNDTENRQVERNKNLQTDFSLSPISILYGVHGKQGVTSVCEHQGVCYTTGRDGCVRVLNVEDNVLNVRRVQRACKGMEWLEKVLFLESDGPEIQAERLNEKNNEQEMPEVRSNESLADARFVMVGFHSVNFVIWDPHRQEKLLSVVCGGGHRSWVYRLPTHTRTHPQTHALIQGTLVFIKQGAVIASRSLSSTETNVNGHTLQEGLHGRGIGCVCRLGCVRNAGASSEPWEVFVTGGEDTTVSVLAMKPQSGTVKVLTVLTDHISNVRTLAAIIKKKAHDSGMDEGTSTLSSLVFSAGGRAQLQCYRLLIRLDEQQDQPVCQVTQIAGHRLDEQWEWKRNRHKTVKMDPETRYMSMAVVHDGIECVLLALGCSDGAVRLFSVTESSRRIKMLWECFYHQRCVLSVTTHTLKDSRGKELLLLFSGTTDGCISVWDLTAVLNIKASVSWQGPSAPFVSIPVHQSGVNALALSQWRVSGQMEENVISLASGGDDGQLSLLHIRVEQEQQENGGMSVQLLSHWSVPLAHSAPLTGLCLVSPTLLASTSPDQRMCLWRVSSDGLRPQKVLFSHTADAAGVWAWLGAGPVGGAWVVVYGQGLQLFKVTQGETDELNKTVDMKKIADEKSKVMFSHRFLRT